MSFKNLCYNFTGFLGLSEMQIEILEEILISRGIVYKIKVEGKDLEILFLLHAVERIKQWVWMLKWSLRHLYYQMKY